MNPCLRCGRLCRLAGGPKGVHICTTCVLDAIPAHPLPLPVVPVPVAGWGTFGGGTCTYCNRKRVAFVAKCRGCNGYACQGCRDVLFEPDNFEWCRHHDPICGRCGQKNTYGTHFNRCVVRMCFNTRICSTFGCGVHGFATGNMHILCDSHSLPCVLCRLVMIPFAVKNSHRGYTFLGSRARRIKGSVACAPHFILLWAAFKAVELLLRKRIPREVMHLIVSS